MKVLMLVQLSLAATGLLIATGAVSAQAQPAQQPVQMQRRPPMERAFGMVGAQGRWWNNPRIVDVLKLTDEQRKAMDNVLLDHREKLIDLRANLEKAELAMEPLLNADQPNETQILAQIDKVAQARAELEKANARFLLALRGKLTPEQWKQVQDFRNNGGLQRNRWGQRRDMRRPGAMPPPPDGSQPAPPNAQAPGPQGMLDAQPGPDDLRVFGMLG